MKRLLALSALLTAPLAAAPIPLPDLTLPGLPQPADLLGSWLPRVEPAPSIPEPATVLLLGSALAGLALLQRAKKK